MKRRIIHPWAALVAALFVILGLTASAAYGQQAPAPSTQADQVLTWTAGDDYTHYLSMPSSATAGPATIVFENSAATGNTTGMPHTLTFVTSDPDYNSDVSLNLTANPNDANGGKETAQVTLTPGRYLFHCTMPGHQQMQGVLTVTGSGGGTDTTAPDTSASVSGDKDANGNYVGSATVNVSASDSGSGVDTVEYALDGGSFQPYTQPVVVDKVGSHTLSYRATDKAGNAATEKSVDFTVVAPPTQDTTPPETSATVSGDKDADGNYLDMATVTVSASDTDSGVNSIEYSLDGGAFQPYSAPVMVHETGNHTFRYRATDKAGNAAAEKSVDFTVVAKPPAQDTTPPEASAKVEGDKNADGAYVGNAKVTLSATDADSGVDKIEFSLDGGPYVTYTDPLVIDEVGPHTVRYHATDKAGNTSMLKQEDFTVAAGDGGGGDPGTKCPEQDDRDTVIVGDVNTGVPNRVTANGCRINELIEDEKDWANHGKFVEDVHKVTGALLDEGAIDAREQQAIDKAAATSDVGKSGHTSGYQKIMDGSKDSFARWEHVGGGDFGLNENGTITSSTTKSGMGMLWFPERKYGNFSLKLQFRDDAPGTGNANSGVFVRFPNVHDNPDESRPEWVAIKYGHEVQILDRPDGDMYKTGSIYGFDRVGIEGAGVTPKGTWNDYEIRVVGQHYSIYRNGRLLNEFDNKPGQTFEPPRGDDPGTDGRQHDSGYIGLQNHSTSDVISFRNIRIKEL